MAIAGGAVMSCKVWLQDGGRVHREPIIMRQSSEVQALSDDVVQLLRKGERVVIAVEGSTLWKLHNMIHEGDKR